MDTPTLPSVLCTNATAFLSNPSQLNGSHFRFSLFLSGLFSPIVCLSFCASLLCPPHTCCRSATRITPCRCISKKLPNKSAMQPVVQLINYASPMSSTSRLYYNIFYTCSPSLHVLTFFNCANLKTGRPLRISHCATHTCNVDRHWHGNLDTFKRVFY